MDRQSIIIYICVVLFFIGTIHIFYCSYKEENEKEEKEILMRRLYSIEHNIEDIKDSLRNIKYRSNEFSNILNRTDDAYCSISARYRQLYKDFLKLKSDYKELCKIVDFCSGEEKWDILTTT